jgi:DNA polymerase-3 subunit gamma/tau
MDVMEIDAASNRGIDEIRELRERVRFAPNMARYKVYIIDEVHMLTEPAANALLKTLEEPPPHVMFVLATTEPHKVPPTLLSRCQRFDFKRIPQAAIVSRLAGICEQEGISIETSSLNLIARSATGSMRDAENLLEQLVAYYGPQIELHQTQAMLGITGDTRAQELARHIVNRDIAAGLNTINSVTHDGLDLRQFNRELVEYLRRLLLIKAGAEQAIDPDYIEALSEMRSLAERAAMAQLSKAVRLFRGVDLEFDGFSPLPLELALIECALLEEPVSRPAEAKEAFVAPQAEEVAAFEKAKEEPVIAAVPPEEKPATPAKSKKMKEEPAIAPAPTDAKPATPEKLEIFRSRWKDVVSATKGMGSQGNLDALLRSACEPVAVDGDTLVLGFYYEFHKEKIEDPKYRHMVEAKVSEVFGAPYKIRCVLTERKKRGGLVEAALQMGAKIVDTEEE